MFIKLLKLLNYIFIKYFCCKNSCVMNKSNKSNFIKRFKGRTSRMTKDGFSGIVKTSCRCPIKKHKFDENN